jgi:signal transduction histidine kinase
LSSALPSRDRRGSANTAFVLLVAAVLLPTLCVLWFMKEAVRTESYAVRQRLVEAYRMQVDGAIRRFQQEWSDRCAKIVCSKEDVVECWREVVESKLCDSAIVTAHWGVYPQTGVIPPPATTPDSPSLHDATLLENEQRDLLKAAEAYSRAAAETSAPAVQARSLQGVARCLLRAGNTTAALSILSGPLSNSSFREVADSQGRLIQPAAQLLALQLKMKESRCDGMEQAEQFAKHLDDYSYWPMPSAQRLFLMHAWERLTQLNGQYRFPTLRAEELAQYYGDRTPPAVWPSAGSFRHTYSDIDFRTDIPEPNALMRVSGVPVRIYYYLGTKSRTDVTALFSEDTVLSAARTILKREIKLPLVDLRVFAPSQDIPPPSSSYQPSYKDPLLVAPIGDIRPDMKPWTRMPGWRVAIYLDPDYAPEQSAHRIAVYLWTGFLVILIFAAIATTTGRYVLQETRLTRLKNDLIATVSHELKTPISSMRVLVDTLLDDPAAGEQQKREYLELISRENMRLSRLIDNFLTFSRMERNKRAFEFRDLNVQEIVSEAVDAAGERFRAPGCRLTVDVEPDLPPVVGDRDALITVLLNLLDNAHKYSGDVKEISLRAIRESDNVRIDVSDNGIGIPPRARKRIFERFYQVDESLSRQAGGCGLGLSIVQFIVEAHGGRVSVASNPGEGSTFTVHLPARDSRTGGTQ